MPAGLFDGASAFPQFFDNSGNPLTAGTVTFTASGTSTPQAVYSDPDLTIPLANPFTLDGSGRSPVIYLQSLAYRAVLKDLGGSTIATADPVYSASYLAALIATSAATTAATATVQIITNTGIVNDLNLTLSPTTVLLFNGASDLRLTGVSNGVTGYRLIFRNITTTTLRFAENSSLSTLGHRFFNVLVTQDTYVGAGGSAEFVYDGQYWQLVAHEQGATIAYSPTFGGVSPGSATITGTMLLKGHQCFWTASLGITVSTVLSGVTSVSYPFQAPDIYSPALQSWAQATNHLVPAYYVGTLAPLDQNSAFIASPNNTFTNVLTSWGTTFPFAFSPGDQILAGGWFYVP